MTDRFDRDAIAEALRLHEERQHVQIERLIDAMWGPREPDPATGEPTDRRRREDGIDERVRRIEQTVSRIEEQLARLTDGNGGLLQVKIPVADIVKIGVLLGVVLGGIVAGLMEGLKLFG